MQNARSLQILLLCDDLARHTGTTENHITAFKTFSRHSVAVLDVVAAAGMRIDLGQFDAIAFHYSVVVANNMHFPKRFRDEIANFSGGKFLFIQDEYRWVNDTCAKIEALGISTIFTLVPRAAIRKVYRTPWFDTVRFEQTLTGFVPEDLVVRPVPDYADRPIDVSYRARKLPAWCGSFAQQKWQIGERFLADAARYDLTCDIAMSESSRIYGEAWLEFVAGSKACLGTESGASFIDFTGTVIPAVDAYETAHPNATFKQVRDLFLEDRDGEIVINALSPRLFEAAALRTLMIMYPGDYSGCAEPGRHYVELAPDHSNIDDVVAILRNPERAGEIIQAAYSEIACAPTWTYRTFIANFDRVADDENAKRQGRQATALSDGEPVADFSQLEAQAQQRARKRKLIFTGARFIHHIIAAAAGLLVRVLPERMARPMIDWIRTRSMTLRTFLKRILLGGR
jgi:hypothetical protein